MFGQKKNLQHYSKINRLINTIDIEAQKIKTTDNDLFLFCRFFLHSKKKKMISDEFQHLYPIHTYAIFHLHIRTRQKI